MDFAYAVNTGKKAGAIPSSLLKLDECLLSFVRLEVNARLESVHFKRLVDAALGVQV